MKGSSFKDENQRVRKRKMFQGLIVVFVCVIYKILNGIIIVK